MSPAKLALAIQAAYVWWHKQGRLDMRFHGPTPLDDEPDAMEQFAADVLSYLPLLVKDLNDVDRPDLFGWTKQAVLDAGFSLPLGPDGAVMVQALATRIEETRLASESSTAPPPCPICGKPDLFIGTDGRPGCPHCEVAVALPVKEGYPQ